MTDILSLHFQQIFPILSKSVKKAVINFPPSKNVHPSNFFENSQSSKNTWLQTLKVEHLSKCNFIVRDTWFTRIAHCEHRSLQNEDQWYSYKSILSNAFTKDFTPHLKQTNNKWKKEVGCTYYKALGGVSGNFQFPYHFWETLKKCIFLPKCPKLSNIVESPQKKCKSLQNPWAHLKGTRKHVASGWIRILLALP